MNRLSIFYVLIFLTITIGGVGFFAPIFNQVLAAPPRVVLQSYDGTDGFAVGYVGGDDVGTALEEVRIVIVQDGVYKTHYLDTIRSNPYLRAVIWISNSVSTTKIRVLYCNSNSPSCSNLSNDQMSGADPLPNNFEEVSSISFTTGVANCEGNRCFEVDRSDSFFSDDQLIVDVDNVNYLTNCYDDFLMDVELLSENTTYPIQTYEANSAKGNGDACAVEVDADNELFSDLQTEADSGVWPDDTVAAKITPYFLVDGLVKIYTTNSITICFNKDTGGDIGSNCAPDDPDDPDDPDLPAFDSESTCNNLTNEADQENCRECFAKNETGDSSSAFVWSEIGCIDTSQNGFTVRIFQIGFGLYGGIVMVKVGMAALAMQDRDPAKIKEFKEVINAAAWALAALAGAIPILQFLGINVLGIFPSNFFT